MPPLFSAPRLDFADEAGYLVKERRMDAHEHTAHGYPENAAVSIFDGRGTAVTLTIPDSAAE